MELSRWLESQWGDDKRHRNPAQIDKAAGFSRGYTSSIVDKGSAGPEALAALADALEVPRIFLFKMAGWLRDKDLEGPVLTAEESEVLRLWRGTSPEMRQVLLAGLRAAPRQAQGQR